MAWKPYIRCPCCGKLATGYALGHAGVHRLEVRRCVKALGYRYGFEWSNEPLTGELAGGLVRGLAKALVQVLRLVAPPVDLVALAQPDLEEALSRIRAARAAGSYAPASYATAVAAPAAFTSARLRPRVRIDDKEAA